MNRLSDEYVWCLYHALNVRRWSWCRLSAAIGDGEPLVLPFRKGANDNSLPWRSATNLRQALIATRREKTPEALAVLRARGEH